MNKISGSDNLGTNIYGSISIIINKIKKNFHNCKIVVVVPFLRTVATSA